MPLGVGVRVRGAMENVHKDSLGSRGSFEMEGHSSKNSRVYKTQEPGLGDHRSSVEQEQGRGTYA